MAQQAVIFDYGRVLGGPSKAWLDAVETEYGIRASTWIPLMNGVERQVGGRPFASADMVPAMADLLRPFAGERAGDAARRVCSVFADHPAHRPNGDVIALMARLQASGIRLGILSNGPSDSEATIARVATAAHVDAIVVSGIEGIAKPAPEAFTLILSRLGVTAADAWFVDDDPAHAEAARRLGLTAAVFEGDAAKLEAELRATGLVW